MLRIFSLRSPCGTDTYHQFFKIENDPPVIACLPDVEVTCYSQIVAQTPSVTTSCGLTYDLISAPPVLLSGEDLCQDAVYEIKYVVTDACGRVVECAQQFIIKMDTPLTIKCDSDVTVKCKAAIKAGQPSVHSECNLDFTETSSTPRLISGKEDCPGAIYQVTFTAKDVCGNKAKCQRKFTIENNPPNVVCSQDEIVTCKDKIIPNPPLVETDCELDVTIDLGPITLESGNENCDGAVYVIVYKIIEACGRKAECTQRFTVRNEALLMLCPDDVTLACIEDFEAAEMEVQTSCNIDSDDTHTDPELVGGKANCPSAIYEVKYVATDACGRNIGCIQQINIDNDFPTIECPPDQEVRTVEEIISGEPVVTVSCGLDAVASVSTEPELVSGDPACTGAVYKLTYTVTDACDREVSCDQLWTILPEDIIVDCPPDISVKCRDDILSHISNKVESWLYDNKVRLVSSDPRALDDDEDCPGAVFEVEHTYAINCDQEIICIQKFTIENEGPIIICPEDVILTSLQEPYDQTTQIQVDCNLDSELDISDPELIDGDYNQPGSYYYVTYTVTDDCEREASCQQKLSIIGLPKKSGQPCDCFNRWDYVSTDLIEDREQKFNQDIAKLLAKKSCEEIKAMTLGGISMIYNEWASLSILEGDFSLTHDIKSRGPMDLVLKNLNNVDDGIKKIEVLLFGEDKEIKKIYAPLFVEFFAGSLGLEKNAATGVVGAMNSLGKFAAYLNSKILISNLKTFANEADNDPEYFHVDHYLQRYVNIDQYKTIQIQSWEDFKRIHAIYEYSQIRLQNSIEFNASELWESQENLNTFRSVTRSMLDEVCDLYCHKIRTKEELDQLKLEQSMLRRFQQFYDYFMNTDCEGELKPDCDALGADLIKKNDGTYECQCPTGTKLNPDLGECVPYEDCSQVANTFEVYDIGGYFCACDRPRYKWDPSETICAELPVCNEDHMITVWDSHEEEYVCECAPGYQLDPEGSFCSLVEDCTGKSNTISEWDNDRNAYVCNCAVGYDRAPDEDNCVTKPDCNTVNGKIEYNPDAGAYECNCEQGYVKNASAECVPEIPDCSSTPNSEAAWNQQFEIYECQCKSGYAPDPNGQNCVPRPSCDVTNAIIEFNPITNKYDCSCIAGYVKDASGNCEPEIPDCSSMGNAEAVWNSAYEVYECQCTNGYVLDGNICIREVPNCNAFLANSEAVWNNSIQDYECQCINGYIYDPATRNCESIKPDCNLYYSNTRAVWSSLKGEYECDCISGYIWNSNNTGCVDPYALVAATCTGAFTEVKYDKKKKKYKCGCVAGYKWNKPRTGCEPKVTFGEVLTGLGEVAIAINDGLNGQQTGGFGFPQGGGDNPQVRPENAHTGNCNTNYKSGANAPESFTFDLGFSGTTVPFSYETYTVKDRIHIYNNGAKIFDTGCVGKSGSTTLNIFGGQVRVVVDPLCDPTETDTNWNFTLGCPN